VAQINISMFIFIRRRKKKLSPKIMKMHLNKSTNKKSEQHAAEAAEDGC
jgi:hypothetical protein